MHARLEKVKTMKAQKEKEKELMKASKHKKLNQ